MRIDRSGANQQGHGLPPSHLTHGENLDLNISLTGNASKVVCTVRGTAKSGHATSPSIVEESATAIREIAVRTSGGKGSPGVVGRDGDRGRGGHDGLDATRYSAGTDGENGGPGTDGSPGSSGGKGGDAGNVTIHVTQADVDLLALFSVENVGGQGGDPGAHGKGGPGGTPGRGGSSCSWQTSHQVAVQKQRWEDRLVYEPTNTYGIQMGGGCVKKSELVTYTDYETRYENHTQPGGRSGIPGQPGKTPSTPLYPGERGRDGSLTIHVRDANGHAQAYRGPFDLALLSYTSKTSLDNGIYEPGDTVEISNITIRNTGAMPTPDGSRIKIFLERDDWMVCDPQELYLLDSLAAGQSVTIQGTMKFTIKERPIPATGEYRASGSLDLGASASRFAAPLKRFTLERNVPIAHPIAVTDISSPGALLPGEVAQLTFKIKNASTKAIGAKAIEVALRREMNLKIELQNSAGKSSGITFCDANGSPRTGPVIDRSISSIQPGKTSTISCHILLPQSSQNHATHRIKVGLQLQRLGASPAMKTIQVETLEVKEGIEYRPKTTDDLILVTNLSTTQDELNAWTQVASELGLSFSVWDLSVHGHLDLTCPYPNDPKRSLHTDWTNKTLVLLNQPGALGSQSALTPIEMLSSSDIDVALRRNNTRLYVVGRAYTDSPRPQLRPVNNAGARETVDSPATFLSTFKSTPPKAGTEYTITVSRYAHALSSSPEDYFKEQAGSIAEHLQRRFPEYGFSITNRYSHRKETSYAFTGVSRETVGTVTVRCDETAQDSIMIGTVDRSSNGHSREFVTSALNKSMLVSALPNAQLTAYALRSLGCGRLSGHTAGAISGGILHKIILEAQTTLERKAAKHFGGLPLLDSLTELCASEMTNLNTKDGIGWARCLADLSYYGSRALPWSHVLLVFSARFRISEMVENKVWAIEKKLRQTLSKESWNAYRTAKNQRLTELRTQYSSKTLEEVEMGLTNRAQGSAPHGSSSWAIDPYHNDSTVTEASYAHKEYAMRQEVISLIQKRGKGK